MLPGEDPGRHQESGVCRCRAGSVPSVSAGAACPKSRRHRRLVRVDTRRRRCRIGPRVRRRVVCGTARRPDRVWVGFSLTPRVESVLSRWWRGFGSPRGYTESSRSGPCSSPRRDRRCRPCAHFDHARRGIGWPTKADDGSERRAHGRRSTTRMGCDLPRHAGGKGAAPHIGSCRFAAHQIVRTEGSEPVSGPPTTASTATTQPSDWAC